MTVQKYIPKSVVGKSNSIQTVNSSMGMCKILQHGYDDYQLFVVWRDVIVLTFIRKQKMILNCVKVKTTSLPLFDEDFNVLKAQHSNFIVPLQMHEYSICCCFTLTRFQECQRHGEQDSTRY